MASTASSAYPSLPSPDDLLLLLQAALANAKDLLNDAQLLVDAGSFPRALALATLSWEELSKADLCALAIVLPDKVTPDYFWDHFRDHKGKLSRVHAFADLIRPESIGPAAELAKKVKGRSKNTQDLKERGLYVDYRCGKVLLPSEVGERAARKQIKVVREAVSFADKAFSGEITKVMFTQLNAIAGPLKNAIAAEPYAVVEAFQSAMLSGSQEESQSLIRKHGTISDDVDP